MQFLYSEWEGERSNVKRQLANGKGKKQDLEFRIWDLAKNSYALCCIPLLLYLCDSVKGKQNIELLVVGQ